MRDTDVDRAYSACERIAQDASEATGTTAYADGYRAAGERIAREVRALRGGLAPTTLERDLREAELEARILLKFVEVARQTAENLAPGSEGSAAIRHVIAQLVGDSASRILAANAVDAGNVHQGRAENDANRERASGLRLAGSVARRG
jgi:hypothetical protein